MERFICLFIFALLVLLIFIGIRVFMQIAKMFILALLFAMYGVLLA